MVKSSSLYTRLTRPQAGIGTYSSLWLGPDHLLQITTTGYTERYLRFYFRDIQLIYIEATGAFHWWNIGLGIFAALISIIVLLTSDSIAATIIVGVVLLIPLFWNLLLGTSCRVYIMTGVQLTPLHALSRQRRARKAIAHLQPLILAAQADLVSVSTEEPSMAAAAPTPFTESQLTADLPEPLP